MKQLIIQIGHSKVCLRHGHLIYATKFKDFNHLSTHLHHQNYHRVFFSKFVGCHLATSQRKDLAFWATTSKNLNRRGRFQGQCSLISSFKSYTLILCWYFAWLALSYPINKRIWGLHLMKQHRCFLLHILVCSNPARNCDAVSDWILIYWIALTQIING